MVLQLDLTIIRVFPNLHDSMILREYWKHAEKGKTLKRIRPQLWLNFIFDDRNQQQDHETTKNWMGLTALPSSAKLCQRKNNVAGILPRCVPAPATGSEQLKQYFVETWMCLNSCACISSSHTWYFSPSLRLAGHSPPLLSGNKS